MLGPNAITTRQPIWVAWWNLMEVKVSRLETFTFQLYEEVEFETRRRSRTGPRG